MAHDAMTHKQLIFCLITTHDKGRVNDIKKNQ